MWLGWLSLCLSCVCAVSTQSVPVVWGKLRPVGGKLNLYNYHDNFSNNWPGSWVPMRSLENSWENC